jgi:hypothetical protein
MCYRSPNHAQETNPHKRIHPIVVIDGMWDPQEPAAGSRRDRRLSQAFQ